MKKAVKVFGIVMLAVFLLTGCNGEKEAGKTAMGRYEESSLELPVDNNAVMNMYPEEDSVAVYYRDREENFCRSLLKDGEWKTEPVDWLNDNFHGDFQGLYVKGQDGAEYFMYQLNPEEAAKLYRYEEGRVSEIFIEDWKQKQELGEVSYFIFPDTFSVLEDGSILAGTTGGGSLHDKDGKKQWSVSLEGNTLIVVKNKIYAVSGDETEVQVIQPQTGEIEKRIKIEKAGNDIAYFGGGSSVMLASDEEGQIYLLNPKGIHRLSEGGNMWETVVDGTLNSISLPETGFLGFLITAGGEYYMRCFSDSISQTEQQFFAYRYNPDISSVPGQELSIYALKETATIRKAVVDFQKDNPEVRVNYRVAMGEQGGEKEDYIKALNTELLAGNGADMIVLDGLNFDSLVEKGVLSDLSGFLKPYLEQGLLFENIQQCFEKDKKTFGVPVRFGVPVFFGDPAAVKAAGSLETLAEYCRSETLPLFGEKTVSFSWLLDSYYPICEKALLKGDGSFDEEKLAEFLEQLQAVAEQTKISKTKEEFSTMTGSPLLHDAGKLGREVLAGFTSMAIPFGIMKETNGTYAGSQNRFVPVGILSINEASKKKELAQQFLEYVLSDKVQKVDLTDGFTVNKKLLPVVLKEKAEDVLGIHMTLGYDYESEFRIFSAEWKPDEKEQKEFIDLCSGLDQPFAWDEVLLERIKNEAENFFYTEKETAQEAAGKIAESTKAYLAE